MNDMSLLHQIGISCSKKGLEILETIKEVQEKYIEIKQEVENLQIIRNTAILHSCQLQRDLDYLTGKRLQIRMQRINRNEKIAQNEWIQKGEGITSYPSGFLRTNDSFKTKEKQFVESTISKGYELHTLYQYQSSFVVVSLCFSRDGKYLAYVDQNKVQILECTDFSKVSSFQIVKDVCTPDNACLSIVFSNDSSLLAVSYQSNVSGVAVFSITEQSIKHIIETKYNSIVSILFSENDSILFICTRDGHLDSYDISDLKQIKSISEGTGDGVFVSMCYSLNSNHLICGTPSGTIIEYDANTLDVCEVFPRLGGDVLISVTSSRVHGIYSSCFSNGNIVIWSKIRPTINIHAHSDYAISSCFSPIRKICITSSKDERVIAWDFEKQEKLFEIPYHSNTVFNVSHHPNRDVFAFCTGDGSICIIEYIETKVSFVNQ